MDFFSRAMDMEKLIEKFYRDLAIKCETNEGIRNILTMLAGDHKRHNEVLADMKNNDCSEIGKSGSFKVVDKVFNDLKRKKETFSCEIDQVKLYREALNLIKKKLMFYKENAGMMTCSDNQKVLKEIIAEEQKQVYILEDIIEMVTRPEQWIENAEFYHFDEY